MKAKLLLLIFSFLFIEGYVIAAPNDVTRVHIRIGIGSTPEQTPKHFPEDMPAYTNILYISFDKMENFVVITATNEVTGEVVYSRIHLNVDSVAISLSSFPKGKYLIEASLGDIIVKRIISVS